MSSNKFSSAAALERVISYYPANYNSFQDKESMLVSTWKNGSGSFGVKISSDDREKYFRKDWLSVNLTLEGSIGAIVINVDKKSFWTPTCGELISYEIKAWLKLNDLDTWPDKQPYRLELKPLSGNSFFLYKTEKTSGRSLGT